MTDSREALTPDLTEKNMNDGISSPTSGAASARNDKSLDGACESDSSLPPTAGVSEGARRASEAVMAGNDSRGGVPLRSSCPAIDSDLTRALEDARRAIKYSTPPTFAVAQFALAEHARAERLGWELHARSLSDEEEEARITALEAQLALLRENLIRVIENVESGSYESTGQAIDEARTALNTVDQTRKP